MEVEGVGIAGRIGGMVHGEVRGGAYDQIPTFMVTTAATCLFNPDVVTLARISVQIRQR